MATLSVELGNVTMIQALQQIKPGDHVALVYRDREEQLACAIPFIKLGLENEERCLYIADHNSTAAVGRQLREAGVDVDAAIGRNALRILTKNETYLRHGVFEPVKVVADLENWISESTYLGFKGFRAAGEMTWALDLPSSFASLLEYAAELEAKSSALFVGLCQFDETRFPEEVLKRILEIHSKVIRRGEFVKCEGRGRELAQGFALPSR